MPVEIPQDLMRNIEFDTNGGCWLWSRYALPRGYGLVRLAGHVERLAHRLFFVLANGPIPKGLVVCHRCDVPACANPDHLFLGTHADNAADRVRKGRSARCDGEHNSRAKLTDAQVAEIRALPKRSIADAALRFGLTRNYVGQLRLGRQRATPQAHLPTQKDPS